MASSSSQTPKQIDFHGAAHVAFKKINDAVYEFHRPATGSVALEIVFFHGFQAQGNRDAHYTTWMLADGSACWLNTLLPLEYPQSRIMSVSYDSSAEVTDTEGRMDMFLLGENLARSIIQLAEVGQSCPVVLVGHGVGGLVLKEVCCRAAQLGNKLRAEGTSLNPYDCFLTRLKGAFFFSTPQLGTRIQVNPKRRQPSPLLDYYELLSKHSARLNADFSNLCKRDQYGWKTFGVTEANITETRNTMIWVGKPQSSPVVEEGSARNNMDDFCVLTGEDSSTICKPQERSSSSFQMLLTFVDGILKREEWTLENWRSTLHLPRVFIGMQNRVRKVIEMLRLDQAEPSKVALVGMGGIGKSTLAKELLVRLRPYFSFVCFVDSEDGKSSLNRHNLHSLVADNLYYGSGSKVQMQATDAQSLWLFLKGKRVLLMIDNVDSEEQISTLLIPNWVGMGSRLVVTSREGSQELMPSFLMYDVPFLDCLESEDLFRAHVDTQVIKRISQSLLRAVLAKCDGLPLTIEVIGSYLRLEKDVSIWEGALESLTKAESLNGSREDIDRLWGKLRVSFDSLGSREQRMFLDLAVFEKCEPQRLHYDVDIWKTIWSSSIDPSLVTIGLRNLANKKFIRFFPSSLYSESLSPSFIALSRNCILKFVSIHDQLRDMGRSILRPSHEKIERCRGTWYSGDVDKLLDRYEGDNAQTETLSVASDFGKEYSWSSIRQLRDLRLLRMINVGLTGEGAERFPLNLGFLQVRGCFKGKANRRFPFLDSKSWPIRAQDVRNLQGLTVLVVENCLFVRLPGNFHELKSLRILVIRGEHLTELPKKFGLLPSLRVLVLEHVGLTELPDSFLQLLSLLSLELRGCLSLKRIPVRSVPKPALLVQASPSPLSMLTSLILEDLPALSELSDVLGLCRKLEDLRIVQCNSLEGLGESFGELESLRELRIRHCGRLRCLPESFGRLKALKQLEIEDVGISTLPMSFWNLHKVDKLILENLQYLEYMPERMGHEGMTPSNDGRNLQRFGELLPPLRSLERLEIKSCERLKGLPKCLGEVDSLKSLKIMGCGRLDMLPEPIGLLTNLCELSRWDCQSLKGLRSCLGDIYSLERLTIGNCENLERLPESVGLLKNLRFLAISNCPSLNSLHESLGKMESLRCILIRGCSSLQRLPKSIGRLRNLEMLQIQDCQSLESLLECLGEIASLKRIEIPVPKRVLDSVLVGQLSNLKRFTVDGREIRESLL